LTLSNSSLDIIIEYGCIALWRSTLPEIAKDFDWLEQALGLYI
jgi:hypothetical protein